MRKFVVTVSTVLFFTVVVFITFGGSFMAFTLTTKAFKNEGVIPAKYTADGADVSPELTWSNAPQAVKSYALIMDDPDAPHGTWVHWVLYNIPPNVHELPEGVPTTETLSNGAKQGVSSYKTLGYGGPNPPPGKPHRYFFKLYALDSMLNLAPGATKQELEEAMQGHIIGETVIMAKYGR
jgi:Raf kinase inhibitor-like YbhB/YbcL family protein